MPIEIEVKMKLDDPAPMTALLRDRGATLLGQYLETNTFYDTAQRALLAADQGLRLRVSTDVNTGQSQFVLTHKGPAAPGAIKSREETELIVTSAEQATQLLKQLGYIPCLSFQKRRTSWRYQGCRIELDQVPLLGHFIEIEGDSERTVLSAREDLGLSSLPLIKPSYAALLSDHLQSHNLPSRDIRFPDQPPTISKAG